VAVALWLPPGVGPDAETVIGLSTEGYRADRPRQAPLPDGSPCQGDGRNSRSIVDAWLMLLIQLHCEITLEMVAALPA
jgi:hypothetical protein